MWAYYAIGAAILWGLDYALTEKVLESIGFPLLLTIELFCGFLTMLGFSLIAGSYKADLSRLLLSPKILLLVVAIVVAFNFANVLIVLSIGHKSATLAGLVEISYPLFIALFAWTLFGKNDLNAGTICGGLCIITGVFLIYFFSG